MADDPRAFFEEKIIGGTPSQEDYRQLMQLLWDSCGRGVFLFARAKLNNLEDARDVCQDTFLRAMEWLVENTNQVPSNVNFPAWLTRIARNLIIDRFRRPALVREPLDDPDRGERGQAFDDWPEIRVCGPLDHVTQEEGLQALRECLDALPERKRQVVILRDLSGLTYDTIAEKTATPRSTVGVTLHRVRKELRDCVELRLTR